VFLAITFFAVRDLAAVGLRAALAFTALAEVFEAPRLDAEGLLAVFAVLLERVLLLDTTCAWDRHAPVHGLFPGNPVMSGHSSGAETDSGFLNVPKIAHFPRKSMIYDQSRNSAALRLSGTAGFSYDLAAESVRFSAPLRGN
jgi:hypothetical protein